MDEQVNPLERDHSLSVVLPGGLERNATVHGSKPVMDLLVTLCATYHLNPSDYTVEVLSPNKNNISFKPNSPIGSLEAEKIVVKPKGVEEKMRRPYMPEATVRLLINYNKSHKAVVRVNPRVPLEMLLPAVCDKCEFQVETTVLLRESESKEPLDLTKTLNDHGLREVFAKDTASKEPADHRLQTRTPEAAVTPAEVISPPARQDLPKKGKKPKENAGFLSLFRRQKKKPDVEEAGSSPTSPDLNKQMAVGMNVQDVCSSDTLPSDVPKKRRAPPPPMGASQSVPNNLSSCHLTGPQRSAESTLRSTKRRAPPPPCANTHQELQVDTQVKGTVDSLNPLEELRESNESDSEKLSPSSSSSPHPSQTRSSSSFSRPLFDPYLPSFRGKDLSDARCALAKVLTSSVSKGTLVKRLRSSATFPKFYSGSFTSMSQRFPDNGVFCAELESDIKSNLPTEPEWEDPLQRKGMTTFKVVPSKKQGSHDPEPTVDVPDQVKVEDNPESEASPEATNHQTETEEDSYSPDRSDSEALQPSQELSAQELQASDRPDSPPSAHDLDNQDCTGSPLSEVRDSDGGQKEEEQEQGEEEEEEQEEEEGEPKVTSELAAAGLSHCSDEELNTDGQINSGDQSEFPQSPIGQSLSTDVDQCGSYTDEKEVEEEEVQEEEEDSFPPPPPPVFFSEDLEVMEEGQDETITSSPTASQPKSPTCNGQTNECSDGHQDHRDESTSAATSDRSSAAPKPRDKMSSGPSRFAQAVALAVQRSRLQSHGKAFGPQVPGGSHDTLPSPPRSTYQYGA